jgi:hypothetical protein
MDTCFNGTLAFADCERSEARRWTDYYTSYVLCAKQGVGSERQLTVVVLVWLKIMGQFLVLSLD